VTALLNFTSTALINTFCGLVRHLYFEYGNEHGLNVVVKSSFFYNFGPFCGLCLSGYYLKLLPLKRACLQQNIINMLLIMFALLSYLSYVYVQCLCLAFNCKDIIKILCFVIIL